MAMPRKDRMILSLKSLNLRNLRDLRFQILDGDTAAASNCGHFPRLVGPSLKNRGRGYFVRAGRRALLADLREALSRAPSSAEESLAGLATSAGADVAVSRRRRHWSPSARSHSGGTNARLATVIVRQKVVRPVSRASSPHIKALMASTKGRRGRCQIRRGKPSSTQTMNRVRKSIKNRWPASQVMFTSGISG